MVAGLLKLLESQGIPLQAAVEFFQSRGFAIDWIGFADEAFALGWKPGTVMAKVEEVAVDVLDREEGREIVARLRQQVKRLATNGSDSSTG